MLKNKAILGKNSYFKDWVLKDFTSGVVCKFQCGLCNESYYGECIRHLDIRTDEPIGISPLTKKQVKSYNSSVVDPLLFCINSASCDNLSILTRENKMFLL